MDRFEPHVHTEYSNGRLYDAINKIENMTKRALELNLKGFALTDHGTVAGWVKANKLQQEVQKDNPDFKIALGEEGYLVDARETGIKYYHCIWIAKDEIGAKQIREISSLGWLNMYHDHMERVPVLKSEWERIIGNDKGHVIITTACMAGEVSSSILEMEEARRIGDIKTAENAKLRIINFVQWAKDLFGEDFYFEVAPAASKEQIIINKKMVDLSKCFGVKMVIGSDAHYGSKEDRYIHKAYLESDPKNRGNREVDAFYEYSYLQSEEEIIQNLTPSIVDLYEEMCQNSMEIWNKIENYSLYYPQQIPNVKVKNYPEIISLLNSVKFPVLSKMYESQDTIERYWVNECFISLKDKNLINSEYLKRLETEARVIKVVGEKLDNCLYEYFNTFKHYIDLFWDNGSIVGPGRGSAVCFLSNYLLGITQLDPLKWGLKYWRFLNEERVELPDIDIDLTPSKRGSIFKAIRQERGELNVIQVCTYGTEGTRSAIAAACRGYRSEAYPEGIDSDTALYFSSLIPQERGFLWSIHDAVYGNEEKERKPIQALVNELNKYPGLLDIIESIDGLVNKRGQHASGVILYNESPFETGAIMRSPNGDLTTQYSLHEAEALGDVKYDFLVTEICDKITIAVNLLQKDGLMDPNLSLREAYDKYLNPDVIDLNNSEIWDALGEGRVLDVFQFSTGVGLATAKQVKPRNPTEMMSANALMRLMGEKDKERKTTRRNHRR